jgi:hypothetical protein
LASRSDSAIVENDKELFLPLMIGRGAVRVTRENRSQLRRLVREDLCVAGFGLVIRTTRTSC